MTVIAALLVICTCPPRTASILCQQSIAASIQQSELAAPLAPLILMHLTIICPTYPTWGKDGRVVGGMTPEYGPRGGANVTCT